MGDWNIVERRRATFRAASKRIYWRSRNNVIKALGGRCVKCGYDDDRALQVDHVEAGGVRERKRNGWNPTKFYNDIAKNPDPVKWQLLCANCNRIKVHENEEMYRRDAVDSITNISLAAWDRPTPSPDY